MILQAGGRPELPGWLPPSHCSTSRCQLSGGCRLLGKAARWTELRRTGLCMGAGTLGPKGMGQGLSCSDTCTHRISWDLSSLREEGIMRLGTVMYSQGTMRERKEGKIISTEDLINVSQEGDNTRKTLPYLTL